MGRAAADVKARVYGRGAEEAELQGEVQASNRALGAE